jgi:glutamyl-tRNA synthetase
LVELFRSLRFLGATRPLPMDEKAAALLDDAARRHLAELASLLAATPWNAGDLERVLRQAAERQGVKLGQLAQPLRAALTGTAASPPIFDVLLALGREESLARIEDQAR